jgi:hypothetical protein
MTTAATSAAQTHEGDRCTTIFMWTSASEGVTSLGATTNATAAVVVPIRCCVTLTRCCCNCVTTAMFTSAVAAARHLLDGCLPADQLRPSRCCMQPHGAELLEPYAAAAAGLLAACCCVYMKLLQRPVGGCLSCLCCCRRGYAMSHSQVSCAAAAGAVAATALLQWCCCSAVLLLFCCCSCMYIHMCFASPAVALPCSQPT